MVMETGILETIACEYTGQDIFLAGMIAILRFKEVKLSPFDFTILKSLSNNWSKIEVLSGLILTRLQEQ